jgi:hypothetical protein
MKQLLWEVRVPFTLQNAPLTPSQRPARAHWFVIVEAPRTGEEVIAKGLEEKAGEFAAGGAEIYARN